MDLNKLKNNPEKVEELISLLQSLIGEDIDEEEPVVKKKTTRKKKATKKKTTARKKSNKSSNKFEDMAEFNMFKSDVKIDQQLSKNPPVARMREAAGHVTVRCRICGKEEDVSSQLIFEGASRYKCNNCSTSAG
tara:strand:+ start:3409 stop:3810 length:402 start_codon:yes stop_codon:yes gene_type:complete